MIKVLVTGFGAFPGAGHNPTLALLAALRKRRRRFARLGLLLEFRPLPVAYASLGPMLARFAGEMQPDAILLFGLAARRKIISIETEAHNRMSLIRPDAAGARPEKFAVLAGGPDMMRARAPTMQIASAVRRAGIASTLSRDAGDYICNACFYHSLATLHAACVGFIHIPYPRRRAPRRSPQADKRPRFADLVQAAEIALFVTAQAARVRACATRGSASGLSL